MKTKAARATMRAAAILAFMMAAAALGGCTGAPASDDGQSTRPAPTYQRLPIR